jgi:hypothetical protein
MGKPRLAGVLRVGNGAEGRTVFMDKLKHTKCAVALGALVAALLTCAAVAAPAMAEPTAWWDLTSSTWPATIPTGGEGTIDLVADDVGDGPISTGAVTLTDKLPPGLSVQSISFFSFLTGGPGLNLALPEFGFCETTVRTVTCRLPLEEFGLVLSEYEYLEMRIVVKDEGATPGASNEVSVAGGSAVPPKTLRRPIRIGDEPVSFGVEDFEAFAEEEGGAPTMQAGSHPFQFTTNLLFNQSADPGKVLAKAKDVIAKLPPGLIGNPTPIPQCTAAQFSTGVSGGIPTNECPLNTAVGVAVITIDEPSFFDGIQSIPVPIFNLAPQAGEPARFGFDVYTNPILLDASVRSGGDYGVTVSSKNITELPNFIAARLTFWGVPGDTRHNDQRGWCVLKSYYQCSPFASQNPPPFLSMPTSCTGPLLSSVEADSWQQPGVFGSVSGEPMPALDGCNRLPFEPSIVVQPDTAAASSTSGLTVDVHVRQENSVNANGLADAYPRSINVALPPGVAINPAGGNGLAACSEALIGFQGVQEPPLQPAGPVDTFTGSLPNPLEPGVNFCPDASKIATAVIKTPLLPHPLEGAVYLAAQNENPFGSLVAMYIVAEDPVSGTLVKLAGQVHLSETGQLTATFENSPQAPFEDAILHFFGGERAPLATPARCGAYTTAAAFTPWSREPSEPPHTATSTFDVTSGPGGGPCPGATLPFSPSLAGGTTNINAGSFSGMTTTIGREDGQQNMQSVQLHMPAGLSGLLSGVTLCGEAQANAGTCGPNSLIGETTVSAGVGSDPVSVVGGRIYITGPYDGAPFGLSIVNPVKAGPFDLEHDTSNPVQQPACDCIVVRAKVEVDAHTAALTVTTDPSGPHAIPHLIDGIPVQIKRVNVTINRPGFTFNPTNCDPMGITGAISSDEGGSQPVSVPFQVTNCATLAFTPKFTVSTSANTSRAGGASLAVDLSYPPGAIGSQANVASVKVSLPEQLPSRLTTLQKACTAAQFEADPGGCPAASIVGHVVVHTPLVPVPLEGPAYFVSHGGEAFPNLIMVLQGYGVTVDLVGDTFISKQGITSSTFKATPDVPFSSFQLELPEGPYSALTANGDLCRQKLVMPTSLTAQNGAALNQETQIEVTGCPGALNLVSTHVSGRTVTLTVYVPGAGKLTLAGQGVGITSKSTSGREQVRLKVRSTGRGKRKLKLTFAPKNGRRQTKTVTVRLGR